MGFLRRLIGGSSEPKGEQRPLWGRDDHPTTMAANVVPAGLDPSWPVLPPGPNLGWLTAAERAKLPYESTACPACGTVMAQPPETRPRNCRTCGAKVYVRTVERNRRRLATRDQADAIDAANAEWDEVEQARLEREWYAAAKAAGVLVADDPEESETIEVTGESHYHADLAALMAALRTDPDEREVVAVAKLVRDPNNRYDRNAIRVEIHGRLVGYLSRREAADSQPWLKRLERQGRPAFVVARLGGGWVEDGQVGPIGVTLEDLPDDVLG
jgi:predicted  nucleic acid-binding Zn-ribbon protein